ncbi:hypothetical protein HXX01_04960 [Candidatus Nomurabacteria bacterium]|nr:hypothetical protein [Candidatus Nomurabacteria bacterium]
MHNKPATILGINPGAKYLGLAVLQGSDLREWGVKIIKGKWSKKKMAKIMGIIDEYVINFNSNVVCLKKIDPARSSKELFILVENIKSYCRNSDIKVYEYSIKGLEAFYSTASRLNNKKDLAQAIVMQYPILFHELNQEHSNKNAYHIRMFEAVALASAVIR